MWPYESLHRHQLPPKSGQKSRRAVTDAHGQVHQVDPALSALPQCGTDAISPISRASAFPVKAASFPAA